VPRSTKIALAAAVLAASAGAFCLIPWLTVLTVTESRTGRILLLRALDCQGRFALSYTHSFNKGKIVESYRSDADGSVRLERATFENFGAGIPEDARLDGNGLNAAEGRSMREIPLFIGVEAGHVLTAAGRAVALNELAPPMTSVRIALVRISLVEFMWRHANG
jgi:hypothetical protein